MINLKVSTFISDLGILALTKVITACSFATLYYFHSTTLFIQCYFSIFLNGQFKPNFN